MNSIEISWLGFSRFYVEKVYGLLLNTLILW